LIEEKFGFRKNLATEEAIYKFANEILRAFNNKPVVDFIFCDLRKVFVSVNHEILLSELTYYGMIA
jgi:hypothetical protein